MVTLVPALTYSRLQVIPLACDMITYILMSRCNAHPNIPFGPTTQWHDIEFVNQPNQSNPLIITPPHKRVVVPEYMLYPNNKEQNPKYVGPVSDSVTQPCPLKNS